VGLAQRTAPADEAEAVAVELAGLIARQSSDGIRTLKEMFRELEGTDHRITYENERLLDFQRNSVGLPQG
jgi:hypothetical protein